MNRTILVPIDISDSELTQRVISHVEAEAKIDDAEVHFLTVIPSLPYYASLGLAYSAELPAMDDLKAEAKSQLEEIDPSPLVITLALFIYPVTPSSTFTAWLSS